MPRSGLAGIVDGVNHLAVSVTPTFVKARFLLGILPHVALTCANRPSHALGWACALQDAADEVNFVGKKLGLGLSKAREPLTVTRLFAQRRSSSLFPLQFGAKVKEEFSGAGTRQLGGTAAQALAYNTASAQHTSAARESSELVTPELDGLRPLITAFLASNAYWVHLEATLRDLVDLTARLADTQAELGRMLSVGAVDAATYASSPVLASGAFGAAHARAASARAAQARELRAWVLDPLTSHVNIACVDASEALREYETALADVALQQQHAVKLQAKGDRKATEAAAAEAKLQRMLGRIAPAASRVQSKLQLLVQKQDCDLEKWAAKGSRGERKVCEEVAAAFALCLPLEAKVRGAPPPPPPPPVQAHEEAPCAEERRGWFKDKKEKKDKRDKKERSKAEEAPSQTQRRSASPPTARRTATQQQPPQPPPSVAAPSTTARRTFSEPPQQHPDPPPAASKPGGWLGGASSRGAPAAPPPPALSAEEAEAEAKAARRAARHAEKEARHAAERAQPVPAAAAAAAVEKPPSRRVSRQLAAPEVEPQVSVSLFHKKKVAPAQPPAAAPQPPEKTEKKKRGALW